MKRTRIFGTLLGFFLLVFSASANTMPLDAISLNFSLAQGGGIQATLGGAPVELFCDDFGNVILLPFDYTANVTTLSTTASLTDTRFGGVASTDWTPIDLTGNPVTAATDETFFDSGNGSSSLARYAMAAYLVSLYNVPAGNDAANNEIQEALWTLLDPTAEGAAPAGPDPTSDLEAAANWYMAMDTPANIAGLNAFLGDFKIVSPSDMTFTNGLGTGGFQELILMTPEPRGVAWLLMGLFGVAGLVLQRRRKQPQTKLR
jgi:hypothetical protein